MHDSCVAIAARDGMIRQDLPYTATPRRTMANSPFNRMTRRSRGHTRLLLSVIPVSFILLGALVVGGQHFFSNERHRLESDFTVTVAYIHEQERFLAHLKADAAKLETGPEPEPPPVESGQAVSIWRPTASVSFSMLCEQHCRAPKEAYGTMGADLADSFASFWALSYFPSGYLFLFHPEMEDSLSIPELESSRTDTVLPIASHKEARQHIQPPSKPVPGPPTVKWVSLPEHPLHMLGIIPISLPGLPIPGADPSLFQAMSLFDKGRLREFFGQSEAPVGYRFWLHHAEQGLLIGKNDSPDLKHDGFTISLQGLAFQMRDTSGTWTGRYLISPSQLLDSTWVPLGTVAFLLLSLLGGIAYARWYGRRVVEPARQAQRALLESQDFNRSIIDTSPVALCVISKDTRQIIFGNAQALEWLELDAGDSLPEQSPLSLALNELQQQGPDANEGKVDLADGRSLHLACAPSRYHEQDVLLCVLMDLTAQEEIQRELERARAAADEASTAKSAFLATMSHEIRTPLYGVLGSLELLSMTELDGQQHQQVDRIQGASRQLLQIISDILDISRIEAGQTNVQTVPLDPVALVQDCTATYTAMAQQKNLLLFCHVSPDVPRSVLGDPLHIRQVLSNLISNAVKFTQAGHIIVRLRQEQIAKGKSQLLFQVADSGVGIEHERQDKLFTPFYVAHSGEHTIRGAGLGLSICARLAELMDSQIQLTSEPGLGSSFSFTLNLDIEPAGEQTRPVPDLQGMRLHVRTPHAELSESICTWLNRWNAQAQAMLPSYQLIGNAEDVLLDVMMPASSPAPNWPGPYVSISARDGSATLPEADGTNPESIARALERWKTQQDATPEQAVAPPVKAAIKAPSRPGLHVLVAEDNPLNQATLREQLERLGCQVTLAQDGEEALGLWDGNSHDLLLTDVNMPNMTGYELARRLRAQGMNAPIIGITANAMRDEAQRCTQSGMNACLVKPMNLATLGNLLESLVSSPVPQRYRAIFRSTMSKDLEALEQALQEQNVAQSQAVLHRMAGALVVMGLHEIADRVKELEQNFRQNTQQTETQVQTAIAVCNALRELIERA
ncbi:sensor histidine kinase [Alcaligenes faecalis]|nr:sensor histidine kinase [Providencia rettgeri]MBX7029719.1 sensor histidine kinase [Alcaligenes faecalis]